MNTSHWKEGEDYYYDSLSGHLVMTEHFLLKRGHCCQSGCRHCPYGFGASVDPHIPVEWQLPSFVESYDSSHEDSLDD